MTGQPQAEIFWNAPALAKAGFAVFPIAPGEKNPSTPGGFYACSRDVSEIAAWLEEGRGHHNIGIATGVAGGSNLVIIEADDEAAFEWMRERHGPPTVESAHKHKGGGHWYFRHPGDGKVISRAVENVPVALHRKGDGGYVLAPPSTGKVWTNHVPNKADLPPLPPELRGPKKGASPTGEPGARTNSRRLDDEARKEAVEAIAKHVRAIEQGRRHEHLLHMCGVLLCRDVAPKDAEALLVDAWSQADAELGDRAPQEVPNALSTTAVALENENATGVPQMERITPGLFEELERIFHWKLGAHTPNNTKDGNSGDSEDSGDSVQEKFEEEWTPPAAFHFHQLPIFPKDVFPGWMEDQVTAQAEALQVPRDLVAMLGITVCAVACAKLVEVNPWDTWIEPTNLFTAVAIRPGTRKTEAFKRMCTPISDHEAWIIEATAAKIAEQNTKRQVYEARLKKAEQKAARAEGDDVEKFTMEAMEVAAELAELEAIHEPKLLVDDASPESLAKTLAEQGGRIALMSAEGGVFDMMAGKYSQGVPSLDVYLKGHAGDDLRVDRIGRKSDKVRNPALTCGLAVQPDVLQGLADKPGFRGRGLLGRFLYSMPKDFLGTRTPRPGTVEKNVTETYTRKVRYLLGLSPKTVVGERESHTLYFDTEAQTELETFMTWLEPLLAEGAELGHMTDWAGKLAGAVVRIAGILHMMDTAGKIHPWEIEVGADAVRRAIRIGHYLILHAEYALAFMGTDRTVEDAKYILKWIERKSCEWFTRREAWQDTKRRFDTVADLEGGLRVLVEHGYIREDPRESYERRGPGRKPSPRYEVNPFTVRAEVKGE